MRQNHGNTAKTANILGVSRQMLQKRSRRTICVLAEQSIIPASFLHWRGFLSVILRRHLCPTHEFWDFSCISNVRVEKGRHMLCALHRSPFPPAGVKSSPQVECQDVAPTLRSVRDRKAGSARTAESVY